jgi:hypothetical protein
MLNALLFCGAEIIKINSAETSVKVLDSNDKGVRLELSFGSFEAIPTQINGKTYHQLKIKGEPVTFEESEPELPFHARSVMIPERSGVKVTLVESDSKEFNYSPVPSKGLLLRKTDPNSVPYRFSDTYINKTSYPLSDVETGEPYIMREVRGMVIKAYPFIYDAQKQSILVRHRMVVDVTFEGTNDINVLSQRPPFYCSDFEPLYSKHFLNFDRDRYTSLSEPGKLMVISHPDFIDAAQEYVNWKQKKGITASLLTTTVAGSTPNDIKTTINGLYAMGYAFFQLVGDAAQVPTFEHLGGGADPMYTLLAGSDNYPDAFIGRFSAETIDEVYTQVNKTIYYEKDLGSTTWLPLGTGIASNQGDEIGDEGEADDVHMGNLRSLLMGYNYTAIDEFYQATGATGTMLTNALNSGRGIVNYIGHGSTTSWVTTSYSNTNVNNLTNDHKLPFIHSVACVNGNFVGNTCFAEAWLRAKNNTNGNPTGAVAFYGSSINQSWAPPMEAQDEYIDLLIVESKKTLGGLWYNGSCSMIDQYGSNGASMFNTWHIFGDASLAVRTTNPTAITATHSSTLNSGATSFFVDTNTAGARVTLWKDGVIYGNGVTNTSGDVTLTLSPSLTQSGTYYVTATHFNRITYSGTTIMYNPDQRTWTGAVSNVWHNAANWYNNQIPTNTTDALIPAGLNYYPIITTEFGMCRDLTIESGARVTINTNTLFIYRNVYIFGELKMNHSSSTCMVAGDMYWSSGAQADITNSSATITCSGDLIFEANSNVVITMGNIYFTDAGDSYIINKSSNTQINNLTNNKTLPAVLAFSSDSTLPITINGNIVNSEGKNMYNYYTGNVILKGNLISENTALSGGLLWAHGTLVMDGTDQNISFANASSYINNLTASQTGTLTNTNALTVKGNLVVESGSSITIGVSHLTVEDDASFWGQLIMNSATGNLYVTGSINWESGSTANITDANADIYCQGNMFFDTNSNVQMTMGYVEFHGSGQSAIINKRATNKIFNLRSNKTAPGYLYFSSSSTAGFTIGGSIWNYQNRIFNNFYSGDIILKGNLNNYNTNANGFTWETGTLVLSGTNHTISLPNVNDCVNNLSLFHTGSVTTSYDLKIKGNLSLQNGTFSPGAYLVYVGGNWSRNSSAVFSNTNSTIIFNGSSTQTISNTAFNVLRMNKSAGNLKINTGSTVTANSYKYDLGTIEVAGGTFTVNDLADNNIKGSYILSSGTINLTQDNTYFVDLDANLNISGGVFNISGGYNFPADWAYTRNINITMSGGVLDWGNRSIGITNTGYAVTFNLTGGIIKTMGSVSIERPNVHLAGGTLEMYGTSDATVSTVSSSSFYDLKINKSTSRNESDNQFRANTVTLNSNVTVDNDLIITTGTLNLSTYTLTASNNLNITGALKMTQTSSILNVLNTVNWYAGSSCDITTGTINAYKHWYFHSGSAPTIGAGNITNFIGTSSSLLYLNSTTASFGSIVVNKTGVSAYLQDNGILNVAGNLTVNSGNLLLIRAVSASQINGTLNVNGSITMETNSSLNVYDINLAGTMTVTNATVTVTRNCTQQSTGNLTINSGSFIMSRAYTGNFCNFSGITTLNDGTLEVTNDGIQFASTAQLNQSGGTIRVGYHFKSIYTNVYQPTGGSLEFITARHGYLEVSNGSYLHNLIINKSGSNNVYLETAITVNNDLTVQGGYISTSLHNLTVNRDIVINGGRLVVTQNTDNIYVGRNWTNNVGTTAFTEGTGTVYFNSNQAATITPDTFYNVNISKTSSSTNDLTQTSGTLLISGNLNIQTGILKVNPGAILDVNGNISLNGGGLDLNSNAEMTTLRIAGGLFDERDEASEDAGIIANIGCTVIFDGSGDQILGSDLPEDSITLCNVTVDKSGGKVKLNDNLNILGIYRIINGEWGIGSAGKTKNFYSDIIIDATGTFSDSTGVSNVYNPDSNLKILGTAKFGTLNINKPVDNNLNLTGNAILSGSTTINLTSGMLNLNGYTFKYKGTMTIGADGKLNLTAGSVLNINDNSTFSIGQYGELSTIGTSENPARFTSDSGFYDFSAQRYAIISARHTIFEKMDANGIDFDMRTGIDTTNCFAYCTFQNSAPGGTLLKVPTGKWLTITGASFPDNPPISLYNVSRTGITGSLTFRLFSGAFSGASYQNPASTNIVWDTFSANPTIAHSPLPANGATEIPISTLLGWTYTNNQQFTDPVGYIVRAGTDPTMTVYQESYKVGGVGTHSMNPFFTIASGVTYYWQVIPTTEAQSRNSTEFFTESRGNALNCPIWSFSAAGVAFPYSVNFDSGAAGWTSGVISGTSQWQLGMPTKTKINTTHSGSNAWVTNLSSDYCNSANIWVKSPEMDFTGLLQPSFSAWLNIWCQNAYDGAILESSIDDGNTWQYVTGDLGFYNNTQTYGAIPSPKWSGDGIYTDGIWKQFSTILTGLEGQNSVYLRVRFASDTSGTLEGLAMDDIRIWDASTETSFTWSEDFTGVTIGALPAGWESSNSSWKVQDSNYAGGTAPEMRFSGLPTATGNFTLSSPSLNTTDISQLKLSFKFKTNHISSDYYLRVYTLVGSTESIVHQWWYPAGSLDAQTLTCNLSTATHKLGSSNLRLVWRVSGVSGGIDYWSVDDIVLTNATLLQPPDAPQNVHIEQSGNEVVISWDAVPGVTGYNIYRSFIPDVFTIDDLIGTTDMTSYGDESIMVYPKAFYMIKAYVD